MDNWDEEEFAAQLRIEYEMEMESQRWAEAPAEAPAAEAAAEAPAEAPIEVPDGIPKSDWDALQVLLSVAGNCWKSCGKTLFIYNDGIWTPESGASGPLFTTLCTAHRERLGDRYGKSVYAINQLRLMALSANKVDKTWTHGFNQLPAGHVPFSNGIYDLETCQLRDYQPEDMLTEKFSFPAPTFADQYDAEYAEIQQIFTDMLPDACCAWRCGCCLPQLTTWTLSRCSVWPQPWASSGRIRSGRPSVTRQRSSCCSSSSSRHSSSRRRRRRSSSSRMIR